MPNNTLELRLPYPPSMNHYWRHVGPRVLISREGRAFRIDVQAVLLPMRHKAFIGPVEVEIIVYPPDRRRRDLDNVLKALLDALQHGGAYVDDSQIVKLSIQRGLCAGGGGSLVTIKECAG